MIICIVGPTGVGKTKMSIELAKKYNGIVVNCDAMQVYKNMNIGTAKIKEEEKEGIEHYLFDIADINDNYTVYNYQQDARQIISHHSNRNLIFVGGTGLYLKAALYNYVFTKEQENLNNYENLSNEELYKLAQKKDHNITIHPNNRQRLIRFLNKSRIDEEPCYPIYNATYIGLKCDRETLYNRINKRVDEMFAEGLEEEVKKFYNQKINSKAINTGIGYKELYQYFEGKITLDEAKELIKKNSRHYAKRQFTWFKNQMNINWFEVDFNNFNNTVKEVISFIEKGDKNAKNY